MLRRLSMLALLGLAMSSFTSCTGTTPNSGIGERQGARGRIVGYLYDGETGTALSGITVETFEIDKKVTTTTTDGFFTLDGLTAASTYRLTFAGTGFVTRILSLGIGQVPTDAYDAIAVANVGALPMAKPTGTIKGRIEFATSGQAQPIANANVLVDMAGNQSIYAYTKATTSNAQGEFTFSELPALPQGVNVTVCVYGLQENTDPTAEFLPTCATATVYPNQATPFIIRPNRYDINNADVNFFSGVVRDVLTRLPIEGVEVFEVGKESEKVTTDVNGFYLLKTTSVNRFAQYTFRKTPYAEGYREYNLGRGANNTGQDVTLVPGGASLEGKLLYANFLPAANAEVRIDLRTNNNINVLQFVKTDATGSFSIQNLPGQIDGLGVQVRVTPWSADPDLFPETTSQVFNVTLYPGVKTNLFAQLSSNASLQLIASNTTSGFIGTTEPVNMQFSLPTVPTENSFTLVDNSSGSTMPFTVTYADSNRRITVTPVVTGSAPFWSEARTYNLTYRLRANNGPTGLTQSNFTFTPRTTLATPNIAGRITSVTLDTPDIDATTRNFNLRWAPLPDAFGYTVYVRTQNTNRMPSYTRIATANATASPAVGISLGGNFTVLDVVQGQAFAFGQVLTFLVVPVDSRGLEADASKGATIDIKDVVPPRFDLGIAQLDDTASATRPIRFLVRASEQLDRTTPPTLTLPSGLTQGTWTVDETTGGLEGTFTATGSLSAASSMSVQLRDTSGNLGRALAVPVFLNALTPNQGFEGSSAGTCSNSAWTVDPFTNCAACTNLALPTAAGANANLSGTLSSFEGACAAAFGDPDITWCGTQSMHAPMDLTGTAFDRRTLNFQFRWWPYFQQGVVTARLDLLDAANANANLGAIFATSTNTTQRVWQTSTTTALNSYLNRSLRIRLVLDTSSNCGGNRGGIQFDDFRVYVK